MDVASEPLQYTTDGEYVVADLGRSIRSVWNPRSIATTVSALAVLVAIGSALLISVGARDHSPPLVIADDVPSGFLTKGTTVGNVAKPIAPTRRLRAAYFRNPMLASDINPPFLVHVLVTTSSEYRSCNAYVSWAAEGPEKPIDITIGRQAIEVPMEKLVSARDSGRSTRQQTCYSGRANIQGWYVNIVSFVAPGEVQKVLQSVSISEDGVPDVRHLPPGWVRVQSENESAIRGRVVYASETGNSPPIVIRTRSDQPEKWLLERPSRSLNGRTVWMDPARDDCVRGCSAMVLVNGVYANVSASTTAVAFDRMLKSLRVAQRSDRRLLTQQSAYAIGDEIVIGTELQTGMLPDSSRWRLVERIDPDAREHSREHSRVIGIESVRGAVLSIDLFPRTTSINWMRTDPDMTIVAVPSASAPKSITATVNGKSHTAYFVPTEGVANQYAFLPIELKATDPIEVVVGIDNRKRTAEDFQWEPPDRHL